MMVRWSCGTFGRASLSATSSHWRAEAAAAWSGASVPPIPNLFVRWAAVTAQRKPSSWCWTSTWTWSEGANLKGTCLENGEGGGEQPVQGLSASGPNAHFPQYVAANISPHLATVHDCRHSSVHLPKGGVGADAHTPQHSGKKTDKKDLGNRIVPFPTTQGDLAQRLVRSSLTEIHTHMYKHYFFDQNSQHCIHETLTHQHGHRVIK